MNTIGPMYFYSGMPNSEATALPSYPGKGKASSGAMLKGATGIRRFLWGGVTVEMLNERIKEDR